MKQRDGQKQKKEDSTASSVTRADQIRRKASGASTNENSMAAELRNGEHSNEQPAR